MVALPAAPPESLRLKLREAAAYLGIGYSTLRKKIAAGEIGMQTLGWRTKFIYRVELDAYLKACRRRHRHHHYR